MHLNFEKKWTNWREKNTFKIKISVQHTVWCFTEFPHPECLEPNLWLMFPNLNPFWISPTVILASRSKFGWISCLTSLPGIGFLIVCFPLTWLDSFLLFIFCMRNWMASFIFLVPWALETKRNSDLVLYLEFHLTSTHSFDKTVWFVPVFQIMQEWPVHWGLNRSFHLVGFHLGFSCSLQL